MLKKFDNFMEKHKKDLGLYLLVLTFLLISIGCIFVYSSSSIKALVDSNDVNLFFRKQLIFAVLGILIIIPIFSLGSKFYKKFFPFMYGGVLFLLVLVHFIGTGADEVGAQSWIRFAGIGIQPSELAKIMIVITFAYFLEQGAFDFKANLHKALISVGLTILPIVLVIMEPDLGSVAIMSAGLVGMLFFTRIPLKFFVVMGASGAAFLSMFMTFAGYRMARIEAWLDPFKDPQGISYQIVQSFYAIANGGILGQGIGGSKQKFLWLPEQHTDFIFSIYCEETGFIGAVILIGLIVSMFVVILYMSKFKENVFAKFTIVGLGFIIAFQSFLNIMVVTGLFPVTGVTLPFMSYGGTSLVISCIMIGVILSLYCEKDVE